MRRLFRSRPNGVLKGCWPGVKQKIQNEFSNFMVEAKGFEPTSPVNNFNNLSPKKWGPFGVLGGGGGWPIRTCP